jgi:hypothetical protein
MSDQHLNAGKVDKSEEVFDVEFPSRDKTAVILHPGEYPFHFPSALVTTKWASILGFAAVGAVGGDHLDAIFFGQGFIQPVRIVCLVANQP